MDERKRFDYATCGRVFFENVEKNLRFLKKYPDTCKVADRQTPLIIERKVYRMNFCCLDVGMNNRQDKTLVL